MTDDPIVEYSERADILTIVFSDSPIARTRELDDLRLIDLAGDGSVVSIEFIDASAGINLVDVPHRDIVERVLNRLAHTLAVPRYA